MIRQAVETPHIGLDARGQIQQNLSTIMSPLTPREVVLACRNTARAIGVCQPDNSDTESLRNIFLNMNKRVLSAFLTEFFSRSTNRDQRERYGNVLTDLPVGVKFSPDGDLNVDYYSGFYATLLELDVSRISPLIEGVSINMTVRKGTLRITDELGIAGDRVRFKTFTGGSLESRIPLRVNTLAKDSIAEAVGPEADLRIGLADNRTTVWAIDGGKAEIVEADMPKEIGVDAGGVVRIGKLRGRKLHDLTKLSPTDGVIVVLKVRETPQLDIAEGQELGVLKDGRGRINNLILENGPERDAPGVVSQDFSFQIPSSSEQIHDREIVVQEVWTEGGRTFVGFTESPITSRYRPIAAGGSLIDTLASGGRVLRKNGGHPFAKIRR